MKQSVLLLFLLLIIMILFGTACLIFGIAILFNPAILGFIVGALLIVLGSWVILGWYKINRVFEKKFSVGKYQIIFQDTHKKP